MKRAAARLFGFSLGYLFVVLLDRVVAGLDRVDQAADVAAAPLPARDRGCACSSCLPARVGERAAA